MTRPTPPLRSRVSTRPRRVVAGSAGQRRRRGGDELCVVFVTVFLDGVERVFVPFTIDFAAALVSRAKFGLKKLVAFCDIMRTTKD